MNRRLAEISFGILAGITVACTCHPGTTLPASAQARGLRYHALRPLDDLQASAFKSAFDEAAGHPRYVVALSPT